MGQIILVLLRLVIPLAILKNPFWGFLAAVLVDGFEFELARVIFPLFHEPLAIDFTRYQSLDKILDVYMSSVALYVSFSWTEKLAQQAGVGLYLWRLIGVILFEFTQIRGMLMIFPNLFEFFFLFYAYTRQFMPEFEIRTPKRLAIILILLAIPKLVQEYVLHIDQGRSWVEFKYNILKWPGTPL